MADKKTYGRFEPVIGLEVHCQLATKTKLFCSCSTSFGASANHHTCVVCLGLPGSLPVINHLAVEYAVKFALAVEAEVAKESVFARKQYFYPDLPKGYQISQYDKPYCANGKITLSSQRVVNIARAHLEEDAGKNIHAADASYVDLNRAGIALIEIVTTPEIYEVEDAIEYLKKLRAIVRYLEISDANLEEGSFRCDANVSVRPRGEEKLGTRCEIKNLNSFKNIERAINYEIARQIDIIEGGGKIVQETMHFDPASGKTKAMRSKEEAHDYRYFPDPDLKPLVISSRRVEALRGALPELPSAVATRFQKTYDLGEYDSALLTTEKEIAEYFEEVIAKAEGASPKIIANWILGDVLRVSYDEQWDWSKPKLPAEKFAGLMSLLGKEVISGKIAKGVFEEMLTSGEDAEAIVKQKNLVQVTDTSEISRIVIEILSKNPKQVNEYVSGKDKVVGFFVGQIMKASGGKLNPEIVNRILLEKLNEKRQEV